MVADGYADAGYKYIFIDDAWQGGRDQRNNIIPDPKKFPSGMKALADYVHSKVCYSVSTLMLPNSLVPAIQPATVLRNKMPRPLLNGE